MKSFIIHLSKIDSSRDSALETLKQLESVGIVPELFEGTYGEDAEKEFQKTNRVLREENVKVKTHRLRIFGPGAKGVFHSHYRLWKLCVEINEPLMVFEDDLVVYRKYNPVDFDEVLILSINYEWKLALKWRHYLEEDNDLRDAEPYTGNCMPGTSGYAIKPRAAKKLIDYYDRTNSFIVSDIAMSSDIIDMQIHPQLVARSKTEGEKQSLVNTNYWNT